MGNRMPASPLHAPSTRAARPPALFAAYSAAETMLSYQSNDTRAYPNEFGHSIFLINRLTSQLECPEVAIQHHLLILATFLLPWQAHQGDEAQGQGWAKGP